ncbi:AraC family transcriptional regulator [Spectribacter hydrogenoxidans]|uniref:AraC family transcriptional regulator n=1 Tax=Spectribacter hydrogenoxidans TaxID=3075608 RepID=A0ABU3BZ71_9GAMM|nr:AraC family transcriptional regulator [Salinisphaera sp. W335]MDT0634612.1 AraC family transcriptional regulator [Salinisphaera sp. W335]
MSSLIRATNLWGYDELVRELGGDPAPLLARFHIPPAAERPDESFLPYRATALLLEASAAELDCPDFGLRLVRWQGLDMLGPVAVIARNAGTIQEAFKAIAHYLYIHCPALHLRLSEQTNTGQVLFDYRITEPGLSHKRHAYELSMANGMQILRLLAGEDARPTLTCFMHRQIGPDTAYAEAFGCEVRFEQDWCGMRLPRHVARKRIDSADPQTLRLATAYLESEYPPGGATLTARVRELIGRLLPTGQCNAETIAEQLAMHPRTLQRRLAEEGLRYAELLDRERRQQAERYLCETGLHLSQITGLLGYAEQSTFNRSCRRWFGATPRQCRARVRGPRH